MKHLQILALSLLSLSAAAAEKPYMVCSSLEESFATWTAKFSAIKHDEDYVRLDLCHRSGECFSYLSDAPVFNGQDLSEGIYKQIPNFPGSGHIVEIGYLRVKHNAETSTENADFFSGSIMLEDPGSRNPSSRNEWLKVETEVTCVTKI